jgi:hypothetical protein
LVSAGVGTVDFRNTSGITIGEERGSGLNNIPGRISLISTGDNNYVTTITTATQTQDVHYTLPPDAGVVNYVLVTDGNGGLSWQSTTGIGAGTLIAVGNVSSGTAFTGSDSSADKGNILVFEGSTTVDDLNDITLTAVNPASSLTYTLPDLGVNGTFAFLEGTQTFTGSKTFNDLTIADTNVLFSNGSTTFDLSEATTSALTILNSNGSNIANLNLSDGELLTNSVSRLTNAGALQNITGYDQISGNFAISGTGTFSTATGAVSLNGATSVTGTNTFTVGTGLTTLGGALDVSGIATFNNNVTQAGATTFSTGTGNVSLNGATSVTGTNTFTVGTGLTTLNGALVANGTALFNNDVTISYDHSFDASGSATFSPNDTHDVAFNLDADSTLVLNGLQ